MFSDTLKWLRQRDGLTQAELAKRLGVSRGSVSMYELGQREPDFDMLENIADCFNVSMSVLLGKEGYMEPAPQHFTELQKKYNALDEHGRKVVDTVIALEQERMTREEPVQIQPAPQKTIPLFAAAAGAGEQIDGAVRDEVQVDADSKAILAVRISGDSMEPYFHHGDIVYVENRDPQDGDIAVVLVNGFLLVKQFIGAYNGIFYLRSLNRDRDYLDYTYLPSSSDMCMSWGTVIHKKIPVVD